jgi:hypothetical protein
MAIDQSSDMKVEILKNPFLIWLTASTCCRNMANYSQFFHINPLYVSKSYFDPKNAKICPQKTKEPKTLVFDILTQYYVEKYKMTSQLNVT